MWESVWSFAVRVFLFVIEYHLHVQLCVPSSQLWNWYCTESPLASRSTHSSNNQDPSTETSFFVTASSICVILEDRFLSCEEMPEMSASKSDSCCLSVDSFCSTLYCSVLRSFTSRLVSLRRLSSVWTLFWYSESCSSKSSNRDFSFSTWSFVCSNFSAARLSDFLKEMEVWECSE